MHVHTHVRTHTFDIPMHHTITYAWQPKETHHNLVQGNLWVTGKAKQERLLCVILTGSDVEILETSMKVLHSLHQRAIKHHTHTPPKDKEINQSLNTNGHTYSTP